MDLFVLFLSANLLAAAMGHPDGAPAEACATMVPLHHAPPKTTPCPYRTVFDEVSPMSRPQSLSMHPLGIVIADRNTDPGADPLRPEPVGSSAVC